MKHKISYREIIESHIGRPLAKNECVHHVNGNHDDNRIENLRLMTISEHQKLHKTGKRHTEEAKAKMREAHKTIKHGGRPKIYSEPMARGSFRVPVSTVDSLKKIGEGNICLAIIRLVALWNSIHQ